MDTNTNPQHRSEHLWHSWTPVSSVMDGSLPVYVRGAGCFIFDADGERYFDARSAALNASVGYGRAEVVEQVRRQMLQLMTFEIANASTPPPLLLATRIARCLPSPLQRSFFCTSGSEATESAIKMAQAYQWLLGFEKRTKIVCFRNGYHGATLGALALSESRFNQFGYGIDVTSRIVFDHPASGAIAAEWRKTTAAIDLAIGGTDAQTVAGLVVEPILGIGGIRLPPPGFLHELREICDRYGVVLIFDEAITGFGRTGKMFAFEHWGVLPDVLLTSKSLTGGYVPLAAVTAREHMYQTFAADPLLGGFRHGHTNSGHAACCAAALAVLDIIENEGLARNAATRGDQLLASLEQNFAKVPGVLEVRGKGLLIGVEFSPEVPHAAEEVATVARTRGLLVRHQDNIITIAPPLTISAAEVEMVVDVLQAAVQQILGSVGRE